MKSDFAKTQVLSYWRFRRQFVYCATEAGRWSADVLVSDGKKIFEIEIKVSKADLFNDMKTKVLKHSLYQNPEKRTAYYKKIIPNAFYFAVPKPLVKDATTLAKKHGYGVIEITKDTGFKSNYCKIVLKAKPLTDKYSNDLEYNIIMRSVSELITLRQNNQKLKSITKLKLLKKFASKTFKIYQDRLFYEEDFNKSRRKIQELIYQLYKEMVAHV